MLESQELKILHVVPGLDEVGNGISVAAKLIANEQGADLVEARLFASGKSDISQYDEVWVHSAWSPMVLRSCRRVLKSGKRLVRMAHANYDPVRLAYHGWKKTLVGPIERFCLRRAKTLVATCEAEKGWIESYLGRRCPPIEVTDLKRFFKLGNGEWEMGNGKKDALHILYLGRKHPLKGVEYLETAVAQLTRSPFPIPHSPFPVPRSPQLKVVSSAFGAELEKVWDWCDVLVLPTLSENFGLVIAEALERGKRVITTDGAPGWECECKVEKCKVGSAGAIWQGYDGRLIYLKGYRDGSDEQRVELLKSAIEMLCRAEHKG